MRLRFLPALLCLSASATLAHANPLTYNVNVAIGGATATGTITTDGTLGTIGTANITGFSLLLSGPKGASASFDATSGSVTVQDQGDGFLTATANNILFNFSANPDDALYFLNGAGDSDLCFTNDASLCTNATGTASVITINGTDYARTGLSGVNSITSFSAAQTPEPSSLILLGTGMLGAVSALRRRSV